MAQITTPANAVKFSELDATQKAKVQNDFNVGKIRKFLNSVKTGSDHALDIQTLEDGKTYLFRNDYIIENGDTISDIDGNSFDVSLIECDYIPPDWYASVFISGTDALVRRFIRHYDLTFDSKKYTFDNTNITFDRTY